MRVKITGVTELMPATFYSLSRSEDLTVLFHTSALWVFIDSNGCKSFNLSKELNQSGVKFCNVLFF